MNFAPKSLSIVFGIAATTALIQPQLASAIPLSELERIAKNITVRIDSQTPGSGIMIKRSGDTYTVLTAAHVVATEDEYDIITPDDRRYAIDYATVRHFPEVDLAILEFTSNRTYQVATIGDSRQAKYGNAVFVSGFPANLEANREANLRFTSGVIAAHAASPLTDGYAIAYSNNTFQGMSGGSVLNQTGQLIGIHGQSLTPLAESRGIHPQTQLKIGANLAIPTHIFLNKITKVAPNLGFQSVAVSIPNQPSTADDYFLQAVMKQNVQGDLPGAMAALDEAIRLNPGYSQAFLTRGRVNHARGNLKQALADFNQSIRIHPKGYVGYLHRAIVHGQLKDTQQALADYDQVIRLNPNAAVNLVTYYNRASLRAQAGDYQGAIDDLSQAIQIRETPKAYAKRATVQWQLRNREGTIADFQKAAELYQAQGDIVSYQSVLKVLKQINRTNSNR